MLQRIFKDMIPIFTIAAFTIFSMSLINAQLAKQDIANGNENSEFDSHFFFTIVNTVYNVGHEIWYDTDELSTYRYIIFFFQSIILTLIIFNVLIAIILKTFEEFEEQKDLKDMSELFEILEDLSALLETFGICYRCRKSKRGYIHVITKQED